MAQDKRHEPFLKFSRDALDVAANRSKDELKQFRSVARREHPAIVGLIDEYIRLSERADTDAKKPTTKHPVRERSRPMHLFDLLREKTFFPQNLDLSGFAARVLPRMHAYRFDKMSRSDIAGRIIEYIETSEPRTREALEKSMRDALAALSGHPKKDAERRSFLSQWERIIKGGA